jgi:hypothetical protein
MKEIIFGTATVLLGSIGYLLIGVTLASFE